jgi:hypothetical protein
VVWEGRSREVSPYPDYDFTKRGLKMPTYSLQLLDFPGNYKKGTLPYGPRAHIALKTHTTVKWRDKTGKKEIDFAVITPDCVTIAEFRYQVKRLKKELETIEKQAEKFFEKDEKKRMDRVQQE